MPPSALAKAVPMSHTLPACSNLRGTRSCGVRPVVLPSSGQFSKNPDPATRKPLPLGPVAGVTLMAGGAQAAVAEGAVCTHTGEASANNARRPSRERLMAATTLGVQRGPEV